VGKGSLLCFACDHPERGIALGRDGRDPGQLGQLSRHLVNRLTVARFLGEKQNNLALVVRPWRTISCVCGVEIRRLRKRNAVPKLDEAILQGRAE
jgi:hypothetical protein